MKKTIIALTLLTSMSTFANSENGYSTLVSCSANNGQLLIKVVQDSNTGLIMTHHENEVFMDMVMPDRFLQNAGKAMFEKSGEDFIVSSSAVGSIQFKADRNQAKALIKLNGRPSINTKCKILSDLNNSY